MFDIPGVSGYYTLSVCRYIIHLWDMRQDGLWENRNTYTYYAELVLELAALSVEFLHHVHMLVSSHDTDYNVDYLS